MTEQQITFKERQRQNKAPLQFAVFKGVTGKYGAMRLNLKKSYTDGRRDKDDGCIFLEMAPTSSPNVYDWENNKIIMALGVTDISKIIMFLQSPQHPAYQPTARNQKADGCLHIYHDKGAGTTSKGKDTTNLTISKPEGYDNYFFDGYQNKEGIIKKVKITISPDEAISLRILLQKAIPLLLAWDGWNKDDALHAKIDRIGSKLDKLINQKSIT